MVDDSGNEVRSGGTVTLSNEKAQFYSHRVEPIGLPEGFPGKNALESAGLKSVSEVQSKSIEELTGIDGVGKATAEKALNYGKDISK